MMSKKQFTKDETLSNCYKKGSRVRIQNEANQCWSVLLKCKDYQKVPSYFMRTPGHQFFRWSLSLYCESCDKEFHICTICRGNKKQFLTYQDLKKHMRRKTHEKKYSEMIYDSTENRRIYQTTLKCPTTTMTKKKNLYLTWNNI